MANDFNKSIYHKLTSQHAVGLSLTVWNVWLKIYSAKGIMNGGFIFRTITQKCNIYVLLYIKSLKHHAKSQKHHKCHERPAFGTLKA